MVILIRRAALYFVVSLLLATIYSKRPAEDLFKRSHSGYYCLDLCEHGADLHVL